MSFLLPGALAALAALLLPILIHLSRRTQWQRVDFAALRWLQSRMRPRRRPVIEEWLLLLVRLLLLACLVLMLAQPVHFRRQAAEHWLVVVPGAAWQSLDDLPKGENVRRHWLAPSFPALESPPSAAPPALSSLLRELDAHLSGDAELTVVLPETLAGIDAERPRLGRTVDWRYAEGRVSEAKPASLPVPALAIRSDAGSAPRETYFRAAYAIWQEGMAAAARQPIEILSGDAQVPKQASLWLDLRNAPLSDAQRRWVAQGGTLMLGSGTPLTGTGDTLWRDAQGEPVLVAHATGQGRILQWRRALDVQAMPLLESGDFPTRLRAIVQTQVLAPDRIGARDFKPVQAKRARPATPQPLAPWFALAAALLFLLERWLASHDRRGRSA